MASVIKEYSLSRFEQSVAQNTKVSQTFASSLAGVSRVCRLSKQWPEERQQVIWDTGADVIGPTLFFFVWWVLQEAKSRNIKRLYFLARDGHILYEIANRIKTHYSIDIDCRYLYGSRQAWLIPAMQRIDDKQLKWIFADWWFDISIASIAERLAVDVQDFTNFLVLGGFSSTDNRQILQKVEQDQLKQFLKTENFNSWYFQRIKSDQENALGYLKQEGLFDEIAYGVVDIGWRGNQQWTLNQILSNNGCKPVKGIEGFYLGLTELSRKCPEDTLHSFLFDLSRSLKRIGLRNNHLYEAFCSSREGRTLRYGVKDGKYVPATSTAGYSLLVNWGIDIQQESVLSFVDIYLGNSSAKSIVGSNYYSVLEQVLSLFINNPNAKVAQIYGSFPMDGEMTEGNIQEIAPIVSRSKFWISCVNLKKFHFFWVQATLLRSGLWLEYYLWKVVMPLLAIGYYGYVRIVTLRKNEYTA